MLQIAHKSLLRCKELATTLYELESTRRSAAMSVITSRQCDSRSSRRSSRVDDEDIYPTFIPENLTRAEEKLDGIIDDISHVKELQSIFCSLTDEVRVLPCLYARFSDNVSCCEEWWRMIRNSTLLDWRD